MHVFWVWLSKVPGVSVQEKLELLSCFADPEEMYQNRNGLPAALRQAFCETSLQEPERIVKNCGDQKVSILPFSHEDYPGRLRDVRNPPLVLYYKGCLPSFLERPVISVVGTRKASGYGLNNAYTMSRQIAACGGLVISGGASGVDTMVHKGAMDEGGQTVAVLGCGVDRVYPSENRELFDKIVEKGCLLSEYPPDTRPYPWQFPQRNRILSGMSNGVLVIEAPEKSGALITAEDAMAHGRDVFAVPGNIDVLSGRGSNALLKVGAHVAFSGWDVLKEYESRYPDTVKKRDIELNIEDMDILGMSRGTVAQAVTRPGRPADKKDVDNTAGNPYSVLNNSSIRLTDEERALIACLDGTPRPVDEVITLAGIPAGQVLSMLTRLALKGVVTNHPGRLVSVRKQ